MKHVKRGLDQWWIFHQTQGLITRGYPNSTTQELLSSSDPHPDTLTCQGKLKPGSWKSILRPQSPRLRTVLSWSYVQTWLESPTMWGPGMLACKPIIDISTINHSNLALPQLTFLGSNTLWFLLGIYLQCPVPRNSNQDVCIWSLKKYLGGSNIELFFAQRNGLVDSN